MNTKVEFTVEVNGRVVQAATRNEARAYKKVYKQSGYKDAKIIRNEYQLVNTKVVR